MSGEFIIVNKHLLEHFVQHDLWNDSMKQKKVLAKMVDAAKEPRVSIKDAAIS